MEMRGYGSLPTTIPATAQEIDGKEQNDERLAKHTHRVELFSQDLTPDVVSASRHRLRNMLNSWRERRESEQRSRGSDLLMLFPSRWGQSACSTARPHTRAVGTLINRVATKASRTALDLVGPISSHGERDG